MKKVIWFMMGLSSQRDIIRAVKRDCPEITVITSHQDARYEILSEADHAYIEPRSLSSEQLNKYKEKDTLLTFMEKVVRKDGVDVIHTGRNCSWFEANREEIESWGVRLFTGTKGLETFAIADNKYVFAEHMIAAGLPVVQTKLLPTLEDLELAFEQKPFGETHYCVKPVEGIYGMGFWHMDTKATLSSTEDRRIQPTVYLAAARADRDNGHKFEPKVMMPFLPGPERSVDMIVDGGKVIAAIGRCKVGPNQRLENSGEAYDLAIACAEKMGADGLVNVQTRNDNDGKAVLLEINLRPSGGICFSVSSGVSLPALFAKYVTGLMTKEEIALHVADSFSASTVRGVSIVLPLPKSIEIKVA